MPLSTIVTNSISDANVTSAKIESTLSSKTLASPTVTGTAAFPDGSASAPSIFRAGDTNTGIFFPAADTVSTTTGGTERLRIDSSGNVGIGTSSPGTKLDIKNNGGQLYLQQSNADNGWKITVDDADGNLGFLRRGEGGSPSDSERLTITTSGNVGIGTASPLNFGGVNLQVQNSTIGSVVWSNGTYVGQLLASAAAEVSVGSRSNHPLRFGTSDTERMRIDTSGNVGIGTSSPTTYSGGGSPFVVAKSSSGANVVGASLVNPHAATNTAVSLDFVPNTNIALAQIRAIRTDIGGGGATDLATLTYTGASLTEKTRVDAAGNVGIGTASPSTFGKVAIQVAGTTTPTNATNVGPSSINLYAATNGGSTNGTTGIFGWNSDGPAGIGSGIGFVRENSGDWGTQIRFYTHPTTTSNVSDITERMRIDASGNLQIGFGGQSPTAFSAPQGMSLSSLNDVALQYYIRKGNQAEAHIGYKSGADTNFYVGTSGGPGPGGIGAAGVYMVNVGNSWTSISDERLKTDLQPIKNAIEKVSTLRAVTGRYKSDDEEVRRVFLIAQDVLKVLPEAVDLINPDKLGLSYTDTIPLLVAAIKEQQAIIATLTAAIQELKAENDALKARLDAANL